MVGYLIRRALWGLGTLFVFASVLFFLVQVLIPGDFVTQFVLSMPPEQREALSRSLGLDKPLMERYFDWLQGLLRLDLGSPLSASPNQAPTALEIIKNALPYTALVFLSGAVLAFAIGYALGKWSGWRRQRVGGSLVTLGSLALYSSFPPWIAYLVAVLLVPRIRGYVLVFPDSIVRWLFAAGLTVPAFVREYAVDPGRVASLVLISLIVGAAAAVLLRRALGSVLGPRPSRLIAVALAGLVVLAAWQGMDALPQAVSMLRVAGLPGVTFIVLSFAEAMMIMAAAISAVRHEQFVEAARAKGLPERVVRDRHAARVAVLPVVARLIVTLPYLMTGIIIVESLFAWPGLGSRLWRAIIFQDIPLMMALLLCVGLISLAGRLLLEVLQAALDPRLRMPRGRLRTSQRTAQRETLFDLPRWGSSGDLAGRLRRWRLRAVKTLRRLKLGLEILAEDRLAIVGAVLLAVMLAMALSHPILLKTVWPRGIYDPITGHDLSLQHPAPVSSSHPLGTTITGIDVLSLLLAATRHSFSLGLTAGLVAAASGTVLGVLAAYFRGRTDTVLSQVSDVFLLLPAPIFMAIAGTFYRSAGPLELGITYGVIAGLGNTAILMRTHGLTIVTKPFIEAARTAGGSSLHIIGRHVLPNMLPMAILQMLLAVSGAVVVDGFLSFIGTTRYVVNWGTMLAESALLYEALGQSVQWHAILPPVIAFSIFGLAFYLISQGMFRVVDPRLRTP